MVWQFINDTRSKIIIPIEIPSIMSFHCMQTFQVKVKCWRFSPKFLWFSLLVWLKHGTVISIGLSTSYSIFNFAFPIFRHSAVQIKFPANSLRFSFKGVVKEIRLRLPKVTARLLLCAQPLVRYLLESDFVLYDDPNRRNCSEIDIICILSVFKNIFLLYWMNSQQVCKALFGFLEVHLVVGHSSSSVSSNSNFFGVFVELVNESNNLNYCIYVD